MDVTPIMLAMIPMDLIANNICTLNDIVETINVKLYVMFQL